MYYTRPYVVFVRFSWSLLVIVGLTPGLSQFLADLLMFSACVDFYWVLEFPPTFQQLSRAQSHRMHFVHLKRWRKLRRFWKSSTGRNTGNIYIYLFFFLLNIYDYAKKSIHPQRLVFQWWKSPSLCVVTLPPKSICFVLRLFVQLLDISCLSGITWPYKCYQQLLEPLGSLWGLLT